MGDLITKSLFRNDHSSLENWDSISYDGIFVIFQQGLHFSDYCPILCRHVYYNLSVVVRSSQKYGQMLKVYILCE